ncbi:hypothetical protein [Streptomyces cavernicola]|uniref:Uncharacterized protein n=1 Tax=Streptomyces cavernicola TaxID=3043613 RepID=A0ABT6SJK0_9ACTN|nr:hypothetical protein [Streptomyces sp. B-S-A6]MDI3408380.1 hypothetical protein [Streptomyces sp. B-S-A6]
MTPIEELLSRALLVDEDDVPPDIVPPSDLAARSRSFELPAAAGERANPAAAQDLRVLCKALVTNTPASVVREFITDELPEPGSAVILACLLQLTDTDDGARFWWQYAAGAGEGTAAYCLYLHHLALGEDDTAHWWRSQSKEIKSRSVHSAAVHEDEPIWLLRVLRRLTAGTPWARSAVVTELMAYMPNAVAVAYLREPDWELPTPGPDFAHQIRTLLIPSGSRPHGGVTAVPHQRPCSA